MSLSARRRRALELAEHVGLDALLITTQPDVRYLSGFTGSAGAVALRRGGSCFFTDGRYLEQARSEVVGLPVQVQQKSAAAAATDWLYRKGVHRCGLEETRTTLAEWKDLRRLVPAGDRRRMFAPVRELVATLRRVKDPEEVESMRQGSAIGDALFLLVLDELVAGRSEQDIADFLFAEAKVRGAEGMSFDTIVAAGVRSALPHGRASAAKLPGRGFVTLDFGVVYQGYCSDMTRTVHLGRPTRQERDVYHSVLEAQQQAVSVARPGVKAQAVDKAARDVLNEAGLADHFTHSTGHGVGLEIHEGPRIALRQSEILTKGMVITVEPGVYLEQRFGVRIEDMLLLTSAGNEVLTQSTKALIEL